MAIFVRELDRVKYRLVPDEKITDFVLEVAGMEWEQADFDLYGLDLFESEWRLEEVEVEKIRPDPELFASPDFQVDLRQRMDKIRTLLQNGLPMGPLILRGSDLLIFDGYARYMLLLEMGAHKCLAYVGRKD